MDISPKLQMNLHPKDADNMSLVSALNIKLSNDGSCITNEESIIENNFIHDYIRDYYKDSEIGYRDFTIVSIIPCNTELVIICVRNDNVTNAQIFRYRESNINQKQAIKCVYGNDDINYLKYHGGKIKGTFTYNVENSLILAIAEYDTNEDVPLRTINLGNFDDDNIFSDKNISDSLLSIAPEVIIPSINELKYIAGSTYKGWYYLFVRYKINSVDYTQWFNFGQPIYVDTLEKYSIIKYCYRQKKTGFKPTDAGTITFPEEPADGFCVGASDYFSNNSDIANETFNIQLRFDSNIYDKYQLGFICASKSYTKAFRTADIDIKKSNEPILINFSLNITSLIEASTGEFITDNYNYFNVKNIINYQNRLYISNYKEHSTNNDNIVNSGILNEIYITPFLKTIGHIELTNDCTIIDRQDENHDAFNNQYDGEIDNTINAAEFFNMNKDTEVTISGQALCIKKDNSFTDNVDCTYTVALKDLTIKPAYFNHGGTLVSKLPAFIGIAYNKDTNYKSIEFNHIITIKFNNINNADNTIVITCYNHAINGKTQYININNSFNSRKSNPIFIPGEVYNFFIHFVDKYGHCTNGYKINNNVKWTRNDGTNNEVCPIPFDYNSQTYYASVLIDDNVLKGNSLNITNLKIYNRILDTLLVEENTQETVRNAFIESFNSFIDKNKYSELKWYQVTNGYRLNNFLPYYNINGDKLFRFPLQNDSTNIHGYNINIFNIKIPKEYIGYFISYEKYEPTKRVTGLLTRNDFRTQDFISNSAGNYILRTANTNKSDLMYFYSGQYDIMDKIKFDYNMMRIESINSWETMDIPDWDYQQRCNSYKFCHDLNKPQISPDLIKNPSIYAIPEYKIAVADSAKDNRMGLGTALQMKDSYNLFPIYETTESLNNKIKLYKVTLLNMTRDIYMSNNKTLIRCSDIMYIKNNHIPEVTKYECSQSNIYPNGYLTYDGCLIYENAGLSFNTANNIAYRITNNSKFYISESDGKHTWEVNSPFLAYVQTYCIDDHFYESKCFKNEPTPYIYYVKQDTDNLDKANENNKFATGCMVTPANSIDLFENRQDSSDRFYTKTFTNYRNDLVNVDIFNKTIRRSNVIQDESRKNNWRTFPVESYKNITENKGIITNLIGIGTMLLAHTEHSLFVFDTNNTLETKNKDIQLTQPDAFDVNYKEVFTSTLGYGGLQDDKAFIIGQFGYIFYNNDFHRFYSFDNGRLNLIDEDIVQWLDIYQPYNVRFGNDKINNRILIKANYKVNNIEKDLVISYNYNVNHFISTHSYYFTEAYNTKNNLYLKCNDDSHTDCSLHSFIQDKSSYGCYDNVKNNFRAITTCPSKIGVIINEQYNDIKFLDCISYKLNKLANPAKFDYTNLPVEGIITPYSADFLKIYNNQVNTGELDILIDSEDSKNIFNNYSKPYWELGMWNYSYLRNNISEYNKYGDSFDMSRIFGNYFVAEFTFINEDNLKIEFEEFKYKISK
nr:MAG TPA: stabilization protein [Crassvirales sp.]